MADSNEVKIACSLIESVSYVTGSLVITPGESSEEPPTIVQDGYQWNITLDADRKASEGVADSFNTLVGGANHEYAPFEGGTGKQPDELNFYFGINVTFNIGGNRIQETIYLAQGHGTRNNWWIGSNNVVNAGTPTYCVISNNLIQQIFTMSGGISDFSLSPVG